MKFTVDTNALIASFFWGTIGFGFAVYGWKQKDTLPLFSGIALMAISYFISSALYMSVAGAVLVAAFFWLRKRL